MSINLKQYLLVSKKGNFSLGKYMVHAAHASLVSSVNCGLFTDRFKDWYKEGNQQIKIVLAVKNDEEIIGFHEKAIELGFPAGLIKDAGYYEVEKGTIICCAIGPIYKKEAEQLKLDKLLLFKK